MEPSLYSGERLMARAIFQFSNVVVVDDDLIGVIVKTWKGESEYTYEVYVRSYNMVREYAESEIRHFIYSKCLCEDEYDFYNG